MKKLLILGYPTNPISVYLDILKLTATTKILNKKRKETKLVFGDASRQTRDVTFIKFLSM